MRELQNYPEKFNPVLIHTGQHYDRKLSQLFFDELGMPEPDVHLGVGSGTHAEQTAGIMIGLEKAFADINPDLVIGFGDINSTLAASVVAAKGGYKLAHVEAGLRSFDNRMPEEINRIVTDRLSDYLFVSEQSGMENLAAEGVPDEKVFFTGNIMIDSLVSNLDRAKESDIHDRLGLKSGDYATLTMHRPSNVDDPEQLKSLIDCILEIGEKTKVVFPCHPRTSDRLSRFGVLDGEGDDRLLVVEPLGYLDFLKLQSESKFILTDSGGIQEETTYLGIPCITMRENTERPATVDIGSNQICGTDPLKIKTAVDGIVGGNGKKGSIPRYWDGHTAERIVEILRGVI